jgi:hypothetical protein
VSGRGDGDEAAVGKRNFQQVEKLPAPVEEEGEVISREETMDIDGQMFVDGLLQAAEVVSPPHTRRRWLRRVLEEEMFEVEQDAAEGVQEASEEEDQRSREGQGGSLGVGKRGREEATATTALEEWAGEDESMVAGFGYEDVRKMLFNGGGVCGCVCVSVCVCKLVMRYEDIQKMLFTGGAAAGECVSVCKCVSVCACVCACVRVYI